VVHVADVAEAPEADELPDAELLGRLADQRTVEEERGGIGGGSR
jgi:hypothetical protein